MLLIGPTRSGKGTIARVLTALLGKGNVAGPTLASLGTNFGLSPLIGRPLAVVSDARLAGANFHQIVERLLSLSGEDLLTIDRKYREPWSGKATLTVPDLVQRGAAVMRLVRLLTASWYSQCMRASSARRTHP
jgi:phage/plasmid-associated DNA primase